MSALHDQLGKRAFELLPAWERTLWKNEEENISQWCSLPDTHLEIQNDPKEEELLRPYCQMPDEHLVPHGPTNDSHICCVFSSDNSASVTKAVIGYYLLRMVSLLEGKNFSEAARFAGVLGHYLQDSCMPVHVINNLLLNRLFPEENGKYFHYHRIVDSWKFDPSLVTGEAKLFGVTVPEAEFALTEAVKQTIDRALGRLVPLLSAIRDSNRGKVEKLVQSVNAEAILLTVSAWHTAFSIAFERFSPEETVLLRQRFLTDGTPVQEISPAFDREKFRKFGIDFYPTKYSECDPCRSRIGTDPYRYEPAIDCAYDGKGHVIPLALIVRGKQKTYERGFTTGGFGLLAYEVPGDIYGRFTVTAGVHPCSVSARKVHFAIYCEETRRKVLAQGSTSKYTEPLRFSVKLPLSCQRILLIVTEGTYQTQALWANPLLLRRRD